MQQIFALCFFDVGVIKRVRTIPVLFPLLSRLASRWLLRYMFSCFLLHRHMQ